MQNKLGVLLVNLGTPDSFQKKDVRRYLKEFLADPRVIDIPKIFRYLLLYCIILPFRTKKSAQAYRSIWQKEGSPLFVYSEKLAKKVQNNLGDTYVVELAMRYQNPSIYSALKKISQFNVSQLVVLPLFPQYSSAATGSALEKIYTEVSKYWNVPHLKVAPFFYEHPQFIDCFVSRIKNTLNHFSADFVLFSYHGLPERHIFKSELGENNYCLKENDCCSKITVKNSHCYRAQCFATTRAIVQKLGFEKNFYTNSFQSRLGKTKWIEPYTDVILPELAKKGIKKIAVVCPSFVADCLETLEEISIRAKEQWLSSGGDDLILIPSLNAEDDWVNAVGKLIKESA